MHADELRKRFQDALDAAEGKVRTDEVMNTLVFLLASVTVAEGLDEGVAAAHYAEMCRRMRVLLGTAGDTAAVG